jgi:DNA-directed RNA polymerase
MVTQKYMLKHSKKVEPFTYNKTSLTLTITDKVKIDKRKQITALMPNLVHSLDASTLALLYKLFYNSIDGKVVNFYSIHDCYGVTAKYVDILITLLKSVYIELYSNIRYIRKFDIDVINTIKSAYGDDECQYDDKIRVIIIGKKKIKLPPLPDYIENSEKETIYNSLSKSQFLIH